MTTGVQSHWDGIYDARPDEELTWFESMPSPSSALAAYRDRLSKHGDEVTWIAKDIASWQPDKPYTVWHDRAVFHFLTEPDDRAAYARTMGKRPAEEGITLLTRHHARHPAARRAVMDKLTEMLTKARAAEIGMRDTP